MRLAVLGLWIAVLIVALLPLLRRSTAPRPRPIASDELVKDPVCGTYIVRSRAIRDESGGRSVYFCGPRCAAQFSERERKA